MSTRAGAAVSRGLSGEQVIIYPVLLVCVQPGGVRVLHQEQRAGTAVACRKVSLCGEHGETQKIMLTLVQTRRLLKTI